MKITSLAFVLYAVVVGVFPALAEAQGEAKPVAGNEAVERALVEAFQHPFDFCRAQKHLHVLSLLEQGVYPRRFPVSADSVASLIRPVVGGRNIQKNFILNLVLYSLTADGDAAACRALTTASSIAFRHLREPETALRLLKIGEKSCPAARDSLVVVRAFLETDAGINRLLKENYVQKDVRGKKEYIRLLQQELRDHPDARLRMEAMKRIGDVAFLLGDESTMLKYYRAVVNEPRFATETLLARVKEAKGVVLRRRLRLACGVGYFLALLILLVRVARGGGFDFSFFLKRIGVFLFAFIILSLVVVWLDARLAPGALLKWLEAREITLNKPVLPLGLPSMLPRRLPATIAAVAFAPVLYALFFISFRRAFSRAWLLLGILALMSSAWLHFSLAAIFDAKMQAKGFYTGAHFYFPGALDELIDKNPRALLKAAERASEEDQAKIRAMIRDHEKRAAEEANDE